MARKRYPSEKARRAAAAAWGPTINRQKRLLKNIYHFDTPGHGGLVMVTHEDEMEPWMKSFVMHRWTNGDVVLTFEEDIEWAVLVYWHDELARHEAESNSFFKGSYDYVKEYAEQTARKWGYAEVIDMIQQEGR